MSRPRIPLLAAVALAALAGCRGRGPRVAITAPAHGAVIAHHGDVPIAVVVTGDHVDRVEVELDHHPARDPGYPSPALPDDGDCHAGCATTIYWNGDEALIGGHAITVAAWDDDGARGDATVALAFTDAVTVAFTSPRGTDQRGVAAIDVAARAIYRGPVDATLTVDGAPPVRGGGPDCRFGCTIHAAWDTTAVPAGDHALAVAATDGAGHRADAAIHVTLGDIPWATAIRVTGETDGPGTRLEVELHLEDAATGADLGCSGEGQGMSAVDFDDVDYTVFATFVRPDGSPLGMDDLAGRRVRVHAIEDDELPCPGPITKADDDMGTSAPVAAARLATVQRAFGEVRNLTLEVGRPYRSAR